LVQLRLGKVPAFSQIGPTEIGVFKIRPLKISADKVCTTEIGAN